MDNLFSTNVTPLCGLNLGAEHRDICSKFIENNYLGAAHRDICSKYHQKQNKKGADGTFRLDGSTEKQDAKDVVLFIQNVCIKNNLYQYNSLNYNLISILQQTLNPYKIQTSP